MKSRILSSSSDLFPFCRNHNSSTVHYSLKSPKEMDLSNNTEPNITESPQQLLQYTLTQRVLLTLYCFIMAFFGILGNGTVLYSSIRYNAIRLDRVSLFMVQNLAVADILYTIFAIIPQLITTFAGRWVLGKIYCFISAQLTFIPAVVNSLTVLLISTYRLWVVRNPFSGAQAVSMRITLRSSDT